MDEKYTIGKVALLAEVGIETIRFYERRRLLEPPLRNGSGYRVYGPEVVERIRFIKNARALKFTLAEIQMLLQGQEKNSDYCAAVQDLLRKKALDVEAQLTRLQSAKQKLEQLIAECQPIQDCDNCGLMALVLEGIANGG